MNSRSPRRRVSVIAVVISLSLISCATPFQSLNEFLFPPVDAPRAPVAPAAPPSNNNSGSGSLPDKFELVFDSTITTLNGTEEIRAHVPLKFNAQGALTGTTPVEIIRNDGDQISGGGCQNNAFEEKAGNFTVVSAQLIYTPNSTPDEPQLQDVNLVYSLNPEVVCTQDGSFRPNDWNLFWMVYAGHFTHTTDTLDDSGPIPLITALHWMVNGLKAHKTYAWTGDAGTAEKTSIDLYPAP